MSGHCGDCGNTLCICDLIESDAKSEPGLNIIYPRTKEATYTLTVYGPLKSSNGTRRRHWSVEQEITDYYRGQAKLAARAAKVPHLETARITVIPQQARGRLADCGAYAVQAKAAVDGIVDACVLDDDGPSFIETFMYSKSVRVAAKDEGLMIVIIGALAQQKETSE